MIDTRALVKTFDKVRALDGLDLHVPKGAVYGLVGPNGAGKSTLIRHLTGIYRQDSGEALIDGQPVYENPAVKARIAYIPDEIFYYNQATIRDMKNLARSVLFVRSVIAAIIHSGVPVAQAPDAKRLAR